jgi:hypothetical protein
MQNEAMSRMHQRAQESGPCLKPFMMPMRKAMLPSAFIVVHQTRTLGLSHSKSKPAVFW